MSRLCVKYKCPNRVSIGREDDNDTVSIICPKCERLIYVSEKRTNRFKAHLRRLIFSFLIFLFFIAIYLFKDRLNSIFFGNLSPNDTIELFFDYINNLEYQKAYKLTENSAWRKYNIFKKEVYVWDNINLNSIHGKSYYSGYREDTILDVKFTAVVNGQPQNMEFDFFLKKTNSKWKIIKLNKPANPRIDVLKKNEIPGSSKETIELYFDFIDQGLFEKAFLLTTFKNRGNFFKECECINSVKVSKIKLGLNRNTFIVNLILRNKCNTDKDKSSSYLIKMKKTDYWCIESIEYRKNDLNIGKKQDRDEKFIEKGEILENKKMDLIKGLYQGKFNTDIIRIKIDREKDFTFRYTIPGYGDAWKRKKGYFKENGKLYFEDIGEAQLMINKKDILIRSQVLNLKKIKN